MLCHSPSCDELGFERHGSEGCRHTCSSPVFWRVAGILAAIPLEGAGAHVGSVQMCRRR